MSDEELKATFDELFGVDERTMAERAAEQREDDHESNERAKQSYQRSSKQRSDAYKIDRRIQVIAQRHQRQIILLGLFWGGIYYINEHFGSFAAALFVIAGALFALFDDRKQKKDPTFMLQAIDELAGDTIAHERIVSFEEDGLKWLPPDDAGVFDEGPVFEYPYWREVNKRVDQYARQPHKIRLADNAAARAASLPYRRAALTAIRQQESDADLPYWALLNYKEANG